MKTSTIVIISVISVLAALLLIAGGGTVYYYVSGNADGVWGKYVLLLIIVLKTSLG